MARSLLEKLIIAIVDSIFDSERTGRYGEKLTERELKIVRLLGRKGKILRNLYVPKENGETSEIDLVFITQKGIFVIESKNYSGWIFGDEKDRYWTASLPNGEKNRFYNPIFQNRTHMKWLGNLIGAEIPLFSLIVFSERCELKKVTVRNPEVKVIKRDRTYAAIRDIWEQAPDVLTEEQVERVYADLAPLTKVDNAVKAAHVAGIEERYKGTSGKTAQDAPVEIPEVRPVVSAAEDADKKPLDGMQEKLCPKCGKKLVLRTAKKGVNAGGKFFGCTGYPSCRYVESYKP